MKAVLLVSHGSHSPKTRKEVAALIRKLKKKMTGDFVSFAFLEIASPSIPEGISECVKKGATKIVILLNFLNSGKHVDHDIPRIVKEAGTKYPSIKFCLTSPVGQHPRITELFRDIVRRHE